MGFFSDLGKIAAAPFTVPFTGLDNILNGKDRQQEEARQLEERIQKPRNAFEEGSRIGEAKAKDLYGDTEQYKGALADVLARQKQYFEKGADFEQRYTQQRQQDVQGRQLRGQQAASGVRGGLASAQRMNLSSQNKLEREAMDAAVRRQALADYEAMVGRRTSSIQGLPLAYGGLYSGQETAAQNMAIAAKPVDKGLISSVFQGIL